METPQQRIVRQALQFISPESYSPQRFSDRTQEQPVVPAARDIDNFVALLRDECARHDLVVVDTPLEPRQLKTQLREAPYPVLLWYRQNERYLPVLIFSGGGSKPSAVAFPEGEESYAFETDELDTEQWVASDNGSSKRLLAYTLMKQAPIYQQTLPQQGEKPHPLQRLFSMLAPERRDIYYILLFAVVVGVINLSLPLGIQAIINLVSGGFIPGSVVLLIGFVIIGVLLAGSIQIVEITLVEYLQRRLFARAALEMAYKLPRVALEKIRKYHPPELLNRFFDVVTIQKAYSKILLELTAAFLQILAGLVLLAFYHELFIGFGAVVVVLLVAFLRVTSPAGLDTSIEESNYKYQVVYWLEEIARSLHTFKLAGKTSLPYERTTQSVSNYLDARKRHFGIIKTQFISLVIFKTLVAGTVLILGSILFVNNQMTLGQFVAAEIIIVQLISSIEKLMNKMEGIYDMLTAVDKVGKITDLPMEKTDGHDVAHLPFAGGMEIKVRHLSYRNPVYDKDALIDVSLDIPAGSLICFSGMHDCGKFTMAHLISGLLHDYEGSIMINGMPMREMQPMAYRNLVDTNAFEREIFEGTFRDNVLVGSHGVALEQLRWALETSGLDEYVAGLEKGLDTHILPEGRELPHYVRARMLICRMLIRKPSLLVLTDYFGDYTVQERRFLMRTLLDTQLKNSTKIAVTNSPALMSAADRIFMFRDHYLVFEGVWEDFQKTSAYRELIAENLQET